MSTSDFSNHVGRRLEVRHWGSYVHAAKGLGALQRQGQLNLKIRSGEHIGAIAVTAQLYPEMPSTSDRAGHIDLGFGKPLHSAVEIKSIGPNWRRHEASMTIGAEYATVVVSWVDAMNEIEKAARRAGEQLAAKVASADDSKTPSRHVVVVAFLLDLLAIEVLDDDILVAELPGLGALDVDYVWVVLFPGTVQVWECKAQRWTTHFAADRDHDGVAEPVDFHELERIFLEEASIATSKSPFYDIVESMTR